MDEKRALTLCGGGAKGAYEIGAVRALYELGETFDIITGTSIGALTGAMLVQGDAEQLYRLWEGLSIRSVMTEGFAFDGSLETLFRNKGDIVPFLKSYVNKKGRTSSRSAKSSATTATRRAFSPRPSISRSSRCDFPPSRRWR